MYVCVTLRNAISGAPGGQAHVQDGVPTSYTDTDFALLARRIRDLDKSITSFYQGWLTTATRLEFVYSLCFSRNLTAGDGPMVATMRIERYTRYESEFQAAKPGLSVSAIAGP